MYRRVGTYNGSTPLQALADRAGLFETAWAPSHYGIASDGISNAYRGEVSLPGDWDSSMLIVIQPAGCIPMHHDVRPGEGLERYHLVLQTNSRCWNFHAGDWQQLELGGIYVVDPLQEHGSINWGATPRIHLVVDVVPVLQNKVVRDLPMPVEVFA